MTRIAYGYMHEHYGPDMDGSSRNFTWIEDKPMPDDPHPQGGWFAMCEIEPEAGWLGPFETEAEAIHVATTEEGFTTYQYGDDPIGDWHGRNE